MNIFIYETIFGHTRHKPGSIDSNKLYFPILLYIVLEKLQLLLNFPKTGLFSQ